MMVMVSVGVAACAVGVHVWRLVDVLAGENAAVLD